MLIDKDKIFLSDGGRLDKMLHLLKKSNCNLEVQTFAYPDVLTGNIKRALAEYKQKIKPLNLKQINMHGPFLDLALFSKDPDIMEISEKRYLQGLDIALELGAKMIVFHSQYNPMLRLSQYVDLWLQKTARFFEKILKMQKYSQINFLVENMFEDTPDLLGQLMMTLDSPRAGICLDVGHVNVYGGKNYALWINKLAPHLKYIHLSDNDGLVDNHKPLGAGTVDFQEIFQTLADENVRPDYCLELNNELDLQESLDFMDSLPSVEIDVSEITSV